MLRDLLEHNFFYELQSYIAKYIGNAPLNFDAQTVMVIASSDKKNEGGISIMYPRAIGDVQEVVLSQKEFMYLFKGAM